MTYDYTYSSNRTFTPLLHAQLDATKCNYKHLHRNRRPHPLSDLYLSAQVSRPIDGHSVGMNISLLSQRQEKSAFGFEQMHGF
jgi:hypothetical protein